MKFPEIKQDSFIEVFPGEGQPVISVLMPLYMQEQYVNAALCSILSQKGVVIEVIISDDASSDRTFEIAEQTVRYWLSEYGSRHRIIMRRGSKRLWRNHLPLIIDNASCDLVFQAHGDDESHPDRAKILVDLFTLYPRLTMLACEPILINELGQLIGEQRPLTNGVEVSRFSYKSIIEGHSCLIGFSQAWRISALRQFKRLDRNFASVAHDRILAFRASLVGDVMLINAQLIKRRIHSMAASKLMFVDPGRFNWALVCLSALNAMKHDLYEAKITAILREGLFDELKNQIDSLIIEYAQDLTEAYRLRLLLGHKITWVDGEVY